jgi:Domain of unknown function (DUF1772)
LGELELVLRAVNLFGAALIVGAMVIMEHSIVPIMRNSAPEVSLQLHRDIVEVNPDTYIRPSGAISLLAAILSVTVKHVRTSSVVWTVAGIALLAGVAIVSEALNQPINRRFRDLPDASPPADFEPVFARWIRAHRVRTWLGIGGLVCYIIGALAAAY